MDGLKGMSTHLGHAMPKRTMSKTMENIRQQHNTICRGDRKHDEILSLHGGPDQK